MADFLSGCVICFSGFFRNLNKEHRDIKNAGGTATSYYSNRVTHLVTTSEQSGSREVAKAIEKGSFVVTFEWLSDCLEQQRRVPESSYLIKPSTESVSFSPDILSRNAPDSPLRLQSPKPIQFSFQPEEETVQESPYSFTTTTTTSVPAPQVDSHQEFHFGADQGGYNDGNDGEDPLPSWSPFQTKTKASARCVNANLKVQPIPFPETFKILGQVSLQLTMLQNNNNKFYVLELHEGIISGQSHYRVFCHYGRTCDLETKPNAGQKQYRYISPTTSLEHARIGFQNLYDEKLKKGYTPIELLSSNIGSDVAKQIRASRSSSQSSSGPYSGGQSVSSSNLHPDVQDLVRRLYSEASTAITASVNAKITDRGIETPLGVLSKSQVEKGEEILLNILKKVQSKIKPPNYNREIADLSNKFYTAIPHRVGRGKSDRDSQIISTPEKAEQKLELIQLMKDMLNLIATGGASSAVDLQYQALKCSITPIDRNSSLWSETLEYVLETQQDDRNLEVLRMYSVSRPTETLNPTVTENRQLLFHGSRASNFVGLLSRGILMPKVVVLRGGGRTDAGLLGNGIYFGDSITTAAQYAHPSSSGERFVLLNRVALGRCKDYLEHQVGLSSPPFGYHSVRSISRDLDPSSQFKDNEFVVFETNQQKMEILVEFKLPQSGDEPVEVAPPQPKLPAQTVPKTTSSFASTTSTVKKPQTTSSFDFPSTTTTTSSLIPSSTSTSQPQQQPPLTGDNKKIKEDEDRFRTMFVNEPNNPQLRNPYLHLVEIFSNLSQFKQQAYSNEEQSWPELLGARRQIKPYQLSVCNSLSKFQENWNSFTERQFQGLDWNNLFIAGGSVLSCLQPDFSVSSEVSNPFNSSDIDIFLYGLSPSEANRKVEQIIETITKNTQKSPSGNSLSVAATCIRTPHAITILGQYPYRHVQIILRLYKSPAEILMGFDIDCCCVGYNGKEVYALPRSQRAITKQYNLVDLSRRSLTYEVRLHKYSTRGFAVKVPGLDLSKVKDTLYHRTVGQVNGLAKLLIFHHIQQTGSVPQVTSSTTPSGPLGTRPDSQDSDYSSVYLPWGPSWTISAILAMINRNVASAPGGTSTPQEHVFISGVQGVLQGQTSDNCWCRQCEQKILPVGGDPLVRGPLNWLTENPSRQILTGSFHPVNDSQWWEDAYRYWSAIPGVTFVPLKKSRTPRAPVATKPTTTTATSSYQQPAQIGEQPVPRMRIKVTGKTAKKAPSSKGFSRKHGPPISTTAHSIPHTMHPPHSGFSFGSSVPPTTTSQTTGFTFGSGAPSAVPQPTTGFSFRSDAPPQRMPHSMHLPPQAGFTFGSSVPPTTTSQTTGFTFGSGAPSAVPQPTTGFSFGSGAPSAPGEEFMQKMGWVPQRPLPLEFARTQQLDTILPHHQVPSGNVSDILGQTTIAPHSDVSKLLLLINSAYRDGLITESEKQTLKNLVVRRDSTIVSVLEVYEIERDFSELIDSFKRIAQLVPDRK